MAAPEVAFLTAASDENAVKMTVFPFQCFTRHYKS